MPSSKPVTVIGEVVPVTVTVAAVGLALPSPGIVRGLRVESVGEPPLGVAVTV